MKPVISVDLMRRSDAHTINTLISSKELMYKAGKAVFEASSPADNSIIVCGSGNNAGDGYVIALEMAKRGLKSTLLLISDKFSVDGRYYFEKCCREGIEYRFADNNTDFSSYTDIVDCIFGTGFKGEPTGTELDIINKINSSGKKVISVDINSGLNGDNGQYIRCVKSHITVSVGYLKTGFFLGKAHEVIGSLVNVDIGIELCGEPFRLSCEATPTNGNYEIAELGECINPAEEITKLSQGRKLRWQNITTNGENTIIYAGELPYGN